MGHCCTEDNTRGHERLMAEEVDNAEEVYERLPDTHSSMLLYSYSNLVCTLF